MAALVVVSASLMLAGPSGGARHAGGPAGIARGAISREGPPVALTGASTTIVSPSPASAAGDPMRTVPPPPAPSPPSPGHFPVPPASGTPAPSAVPVSADPPPDSPPAASDTGGGSWWGGIGEHVQAAINAWLTALVAGAVGPAVQTAGALMNPARLTATGALHQLWAESRQIANTIYVLFVLAGGIIVLGFETVHKRYAFTQIAPRLMWGALAANLSWPVITTATQLATALAVAVAGTTLTPADLLSQLVAATTDGGPTYLVILGGVVGVLALVLTFTLIVITAVLLLLTVLAPLALCLHALPHTEAIAWCWWRAFCGALAVPTLHALLLALLARVLLTPGGLAVGLLGPPIGMAAPGSPLNLLVVIALLYLMIKIPGWVLRAATGSAGHRTALVRGVLSSAVITGGLAALGVSFPAATGRGAGVLGSRAGLAALGLRANLRRPGSSTAPGATRASTRTSTRPGASGGPAAGSGSESTGSVSGDPYARARLGRGGQLLLPLPGVSAQRSSPARTQWRPHREPPSAARAHATATGGGAPPRCSRGSPRLARQLSLPLGRDWPEHRPVLGRDGQYRLPIHPPRTRRPQPNPAGRTGPAANPTPAVTPPPARPGPTQLPLPLIWPTPPRRRGNHRPGNPQPPPRRGQPQ